MITGMVPKCSKLLLMSAQTFEVIPSTQACGASIVGIDLRARLSQPMVRSLQAQWRFHLPENPPEACISVGPESPGTTR